MHKKSQQIWLGCLLWLSCMLLARAETLWRFATVSEINFFGDHNPALRAQLAQQYQQFEIGLHDDILTISHSPSNTICSAEYIKKNMPALQYLYSNNTVLLYQQLFQQQQLQFPERLDVLMSLYPEQACPVPFDELMLSDDFLFVVDEDFVIFFQAVNPH